MAVENQVKFRLVMLGPPGAGKGTQAERIAARKGVPHVSTGDIFRTAVSSQTELGKKVKGFLDSGQLVPNETVIELMRERLLQSDCVKGFVLDGFPRTLEQAKTLDELMGELGLALTHVVHLIVADELLIERIKKRGTMGSGRSDDDEKVARNRLKVYQEQTIPLIEYYKRSSCLHDVDGVGTVEEVNDRIWGIIGEK